LFQRQLAREPERFFCFPISEFVIMIPPGGVCCHRQRGSTLISDSSAQTATMNGRSDPMKQDKLVHIACNLCGADDTAPWAVRNGMSVIKCRQCGLIYVNPRVDDPNPDDIYDTSYFDYYKLTEWANGKTFIRRVKLLEKYSPGKGRILDVGCAIGDFMQVAKSRGWDPHGVDITADSIDEIRRRTGVEIKVGDFATVPYDENYFDVVNLGDSIEHMMDPHDALRKVHHILKPGGIGYLRTPDALHLMPLLFRQSWIQIKPKEHLFYFTRKTMRRMLEQSGLEILKVSSSGTYCTVDILLNRITHYFTRQRVIPATLRFMANSLRLGRIRFPLDTLEEMEVIFRKPS